jgi:FlaA1/EpsC-like NDP-sugar epimerase
LTSGKVTVSDLRELNIEDLLGRDPVAPNPFMFAKNISVKVVMVTGAGGSIGSELCRQILKAKPSTLLLVELSEFALYEIHRELEAAVQEMAHQELDKSIDPLSYPTSTARIALSPALIPLLANVRDAHRMAEVLRTWRPSTVYHAAAYKHVPLVEHNPSEGVKNNVEGTLITAMQAALHGVTDFVLVSTDKAVRPTNIMGTTKRLAEMVLQAKAASQVLKFEKQGGKTRFSMVRFGNVLGSSGSVVPLFRKQIAQGGPITLTDERMTRYFMTIPEAAQLVIQAATMAKGGEVFVLDMGQPVKILDLAKRMVELSGLSVLDSNNPMGDIEIQVTGLRPGEKLYEELLIGDNPLRTSHPRIMKAHEEFLPWDELERKLNILNVALESNNVPLVRTLLKELVPGYQPESEVVDWVWMENEKASA